MRNVKTVIQNVGEDSEQHLVGVSLNSKLKVEFYTALKGK